MIWSSNLLLFSNFDLITSLIYDQVIEISACSLILSLWQVWLDIELVTENTCEIWWTAPLDFLLKNYRCFQDKHESPPEGRLPDATKGNLLLSL